MPGPDATDKPLEAFQQPLEELVARVRRAHKVVETAWANALAAALDAGDAVLALQQELQGRGIGWQAWFREWGYLPLSTAKLYAQLAVHRDEIETARAQVPELSLRAARRLISKPQPAPETSQDEPPAATTVMVAEAAGIMGRADISFDSAGETACRDLENKVRRLETENIGLRSEVGELKATRPLDLCAWSAASPSEREHFLNAVGRPALCAVIPKSWDIEHRVLRAVSSEKLLGELERRLPTQLQKKHRATINAISHALDSANQHAGPVLNLEAIPITDTSVAKH
jgi:hypothetical protein